jgi:hypothetical protein
MPPEYYLGAAVAVILLVLLGSFLKGKRVGRREFDKGNGKDELTNQLSRIADALEAIAAHWQALPFPVEQKAAPLEKAPAPSAPEPSASEPNAPEPVDTDQENGGEPKKHRYVSLSMFGR